MGILVEHRLGKPVPVSRVRRVHRDLPALPRAVQRRHIGQGLVRPVGKDGEAGKRRPASLRQKAAHLRPERLVFHLPIAVRPERAFRVGPEGLILLDPILRQHPLGGAVGVPAAAVAQISGGIALVKPVELRHQPRLLPLRLPAAGGLAGLTQRDDALQQSNHPLLLPLRDPFCQPAKLGPGQMQGLGMRRAGARLRRCGGCGSAAGRAAQQQKQDAYRRFFHPTTSFLVVFYHGCGGKKRACPASFRDAGHAPGFSRISGPPKAEHLHMGRLRFVFHDGHTAVKRQQTFVCRSGRGLLRGGR